MSSQQQPQAARVALVTGGNRGIGKSIVLALAEKGISVVFTYNSHPEEPPAVIESVESLGNGAKAASLQLNVTEFDKYDTFLSSLQSILKDWGYTQLDIFIPCAGIGSITPFGQINAQTIDDLYNIQFKAPILLTQLVAPILKEKTSVIITISSGLARFSLPPLGVYAGLKGGIEVWTRYLAKELGSKGIRAICARVGAVESDFGGGRVRDDKDTNKHIASTIALGRVGLPSDIGPAIANIIDLTWVTGTVIEMSGGQQV
ncbi:hypothetical protein BD324DRAFT_628201 [Kockovaella imperatae]|uniref:Uncharacterized protein n=1 Tax=Kockovaella imperatae TaxID=4999 RepID=A0A1Y1UE25_9TREE|nr:hypothetical protein BD324DRAFT_628201 [Kockovaella imperatae]ORX36293.1 hypothetical protein BD324DRAFT_628201 [Kockovaella imperatae]